jgi:subtilisin-like proprotein convertase family protein
MKSIVKKVAVLVVGFLLAGAACADLVESGDLNLEIPDNSDFGVSDTLTVSGLDGLIGNLAVSLDIGATDGGVAFNGDLYVYLQHGASLAVLLNRSGKSDENDFGYSDDGFNVTFTLYGDDIHTYGGNDGETLTGEWGADGRKVDPNDVVDTDAQTAELDVFLNTEANGEWTLFVADLNSGGTAQVNNWSLSVDAVPEPYTISLIGLFGVGFLFVRRLYL